MSAPQKASRLVAHQVAETKARAATVLAERALDHAATGGAVRVTNATMPSARAMLGRMSAELSAKRITFCGHQSRNRAVVALFWMHDAAGKVRCDSCSQRALLRTDFAPGPTLCTLCGNPAQGLGKGLRATLLEAFVTDGPDGSPLITGPVTLTYQVCNRHAAEDGSL